MAKVLISAIGVGLRKREYEPTTYKFLDSYEEYRTSFVAAALCKHLKVDKLYLVGTAKSMWEEVYNYFAREALQSVDSDYWHKLADKAEAFDVKNSKDGVNEKDLEELNKTIDNYLEKNRENSGAYLVRESASGGSKCFIINYGLDEVQLWNNFSTFMQISNMLQEDDEVYLDITHAFRSIALFNYITLDLIGILKFRKTFKLAGLFYGMLDVKSELGYAPVVDLSHYYNLTQWARGAYNFINFGNGYILADLFRAPELSEYIRNISEIVNINYIDEFKKNIDSLNTYLKMYSEKQTENFDPFAKYMIPYLLSFVERFRGISSTGQLQLKLAEWYFDNKRYAQGYICLAESIITKFLEIYHKKDATITYKVENRDKIKNLLRYKLNEGKYKKIYNVYKEINYIRNTIAHAGYYANNKTFDEYIKNSYKYLNDVKKLIFYDKIIAEITQKYPFNTL